MSLKLFIIRIKSILNIFFISNRNSATFKVEADKGFFFSSFDNAFICQKKNHFQITVQSCLGSFSQPVFLRAKNSNATFEPVHMFQLQFYGVKQESARQVIQVRQSSSDRKPFDYTPVEFKFKPNDEVSKQTQMRLHFAQTTANNNRKRSKSGEIVSNPDQRYFLLVTEIQAVLKDGRTLPVYAAASSRVIVRVSQIQP